MERADRWDREDPERWLPNRFFPPPGLYFDGNSLGLMPRTAPDAVQEVLTEWRQAAVTAWGMAPAPWISRVEAVARRLAPLVGAEAPQLTLLPSTTVALHQLLATLYRPTAARWRIVMDQGAFPTDRYAVLSHLRLHGLPSSGLVTVPGDDDGVLDPAAVQASITGDTALVLLPSVVYTTGQALPVASLTRAAHRAGAIAVWDLCHSAGLMPHALLADDVDAAVFCTYKYLSGGPGAPAGLFLHPRWLPPRPGLGGWWGSDKRRQFQMETWPAVAPDAGGLQLGTPSMLALAPLSASLALFEEVGLRAVWERSQRLMAVLEDLAERHLQPAGYHIVRPPVRGGHLALRHPAALRLSLALRRRRVIVDFRPPDVLRVCPAPLTTRFTDVVEGVRAMAETAMTEAEPEPIPPVL
jgi:kynureninase